ncbi:MAG: hypothetical protein AAB354_13595 [candidate division KSB1 bacterium]
MNRTVYLGTTIPNYYFDEREPIKKFGEIARTARLTNPLLQAQYEAQMRLDERANHAIKCYVENSHQAVLELASKYGLTIRYGEINGGYLEPKRKVALLQEHEPVFVAI